MRGRLDLGPDAALFTDVHQIAGESIRQVDRGRRQAVGREQLSLLDPRRRVQVSVNEVSPPTSSTLCRRQARIIPRYRRSTSDEVREAGMATATSIYCGLPPMAAMSLRLATAAL